MCEHFRPGSKVFIFLRFHSFSNSGSHDTYHIAAGLYNKTHLFLWQPKLPDYLGDISVTKATVKKYMKESCSLKLADSSVP